MLIAQITDMHVARVGSGLDRILCTADYLVRAVAHLNALRPRPDLVIATGDLVEHGDAEEYGRLREILGALAMPVYVIPGNHDEREALRAAFLGDGYLPADGFLQYAVEDFPVRLLALDTNVPGENSGRLCAERLAWLDARLAEAPERPTIVMMHHPPFVTGIRVMDDMGLDGIDALAGVVRRHQQVERIVSGHIHRPIVRRFAGTLACTSPATAHQVALDLPPAVRLAAVMEPPACLLHLWLGEAEGLVTHVSVVGERPSVAVYDDGGWISNPVVPAGFHPHS